jgi:hypothetical protein
MACDVISALSSMIDPCPRVPCGPCLKTQGRALQLGRCGTLLGRNGAGPFSYSFQGRSIVNVKRQGFARSQ